MPSIIGVRKLPLTVADTPSTPWKKSGMKMITPNMPIPLRKITNSAIATMLFLNRERGIMGSAVLDSMIINAIPMITERAIIEMIVAENQG